MMQIDKIKNAHHRIFTDIKNEQASLTMQQCLKYFSVF